MNCIRNYPWYRGWHEDYSEQGLVIVGVHTPETPGEREIDRVRKKVKENQMAYPVAVDNSGSNWSAWSNRWWPAVYLIDKRGGVRYWWYGELNWQGAEGGKIMRRRIEELLAEE